MKTIAIYSGRFHPPHLGHKSVYMSLVNKFGKENVYVVSSGKQAPLSSPFEFEQKQFLWRQLGVAKSKVIQVRNPYQPKEVTENFDPNNTAIVFALSEKDSGRFTFKPKKDGSPSYMQAYQEPLRPLSEVGYVLTVPTINFSVQQKEIKSASEIRNMYINANTEERIQILQDLYGKVTNEIKHIFDKQLSLTESLRKIIDERNNLLESKAYTNINAIISKALILERLINEEEYKWQK